MSKKVYWIVFDPTGKFVGKNSPTYAVKPDQRIAIDKQREIDESRLGYYYESWTSGPWFVEEWDKSKLFNSLSHIRRALGSCRYIGLINLEVLDGRLTAIEAYPTDKKDLTFDAYSAHCTDGTVQKLTEVFG